MVLLHGEELGFVGWWSALIMLIKSLVSSNSCCICVASYVNWNACIIATYIIWGSYMHVYVCVRVCVCVCVSPALETWNLSVAISWHAECLGPYCDFPGCPIIIAQPNCSNPHKCPCNLNHNALAVTLHCMGRVSSSDEFFFCSV